MSLKLDIVYEIRKKLNSHQSIDNLFSSVWRSKNIQKGFGLTEDGFKFLTNVLELEHWTFEFDLEHMSSATVLMIDRYLKTPYYLSNRRNSKTRKISIFSEELATQLVLYGNDLPGLLRAQDLTAVKPITKPD